MTASNLPGWRINVVDGVHRKFQRPRLDDATRAFLSARIRQCEAAVADIRRRFADSPGAAWVAAGGYAAEARKHRRELKRDGRARKRERRERP